MSRRLAAEMTAVPYPAPSFREDEPASHVRLRRVGETVAPRAADGVAFVREEGDAVRRLLREPKEAWA